MASQKSDNPSRYHPWLLIAPYPAAVARAIAERSDQACTIDCFGKEVPKWSHTSFHWTGRRPWAIAMCAERFTNLPYLHTTALSVLP